MVSPTLTPDARAHFDAFGFVLLPGCIEAGVLRAEVERTLAAADASAGGAPLRSDVAAFGYAPLMTARTPYSLELLDRISALAVVLLGGPVLPVRAKGVRYVGTTTWHQDSAGPLATLGCLVYLDPMTTTDGALRVLPGSHRAEFGAAVATHIEGHPQPLACPAHVVASRPGDLLIFDERLYHASSAAEPRLQWRVDYMRAPEDDAQARACRQYLAGIFDAKWIGPYDPDQHPTYDEAFQQYAFRGVPPVVVARSRRATPRRCLARFHRAKPVRPPRRYASGSLRSQSVN